MNSAKAWRRVSVFLSVVLTATPVLVPATAAAQTDAQKQQAKEQAKEHWERAKRLYEVGRYAEAIEEYQKAYLLVDDPNMIFNIAQCYRLMDKPEEAVRFYRTYLRRAPNAANREDVEKRIADLENTVEERRRTTPTTPAPQATEPPAPTTPPVPTAPAPVGAPPPRVPTDPIPPVAVRRTAGEAEKPSNVVPYALIGTGSALVITSLLAGGVARTRARQVSQASQSQGTFNPSAQSAGKAASTVAVVTGLVGLAAGITGGILLLGGSDDEPRTASAPRGILYPIAGPSVAGAGAHFTF